MNIYSDYSLLTHNTFRIDAKANLFVEYSSVDELRLFLQSEQAQGIPLLHIGGGSNLLFTDNFRGAVLHSKITDITYDNTGNNEVIATVGAGVVWDDFCADAAAKGLWGIENLSGIPGEVGASAVQNIGAYGVEACNAIAEVEVLDRNDLTSRLIPAAECDYGYRHSRFKTEWADRYFITAVKYRLHTTPHPQLDYAGLSALKDKSEALTPLQIRQHITGIRSGKLPDPAVIGSAGSFFKNPVIDTAQYRQLLSEYPSMPHYSAPDNMVKIPAAWLIDQCGMKGFSVGNAQVYDKQPLVIVNNGHATASDITTLATKIQQKVAEKFNITIHPEVIYIP